MSKGKRKVGTKTRPATPRDVMGKDTRHRGQLEAVLAEAKRLGLFAVVEKGAWRIYSARTGDAVLAWYESDRHWHSLAGPPRRGVAPHPFAALRQGLAQAVLVETARVVAGG